MNILDKIHDYKIGDRRYCNNCNDLLPGDHQGLDYCDSCRKSFDNLRVIKFRAWIKQQIKQENIKISISGNALPLFKRASND